MKLFFKQKDVIYPLGIWIIFIIWYFLFGYPSLLQSAERALDDIVKSHSFWFFSQPPIEKDNIIIVEIDQESRHRLNLKWPWPRKLTAKMIENIAACDPGVIGLDIVFSGESDPVEDQKLISALKSHPRIISATYLQSSGLIRPAPAFENALSSTGFVNRPLEGGRVRSIFPVIRNSDHSLLTSLELEILRAFQGIDESHTTVYSEDELKLGKQEPVKLKNGTLPLNYLVYHSGFKTVPAYKVLDGQIDPTDFKDKIVLVGATDPILHDEYDTVLGIFPGVAIISNALVMLLSQRLIVDLPLYVTLLFGLITSALIYGICRKSGLLFSVLALAVIMAISFLFCIYLRGQDIRLSYLTLFFLQTITFLAFNLYHYMSLIYVRKKIRHQALFDPLTGLYSNRYFRLLAEEKSQSNAAVTLLAVKIDNYNDLLQTYSIDEVRDLIKEIAASLKSALALTKQDIMATVIPGIVGVLQLDSKGGRMAHRLEDFIAAAQGQHWSIGLNTTAVSLNGIILHKDAGQGISKCDPIAQMDHAFNTFDGRNRILCRPLGDFQTDQGPAEIDLHNEYDFIIYDWEEKAKELESSLSALSKAHFRMDRLNIGIIKTLARSIDAKSAWTAGHSERVTRIAVELGEKMGLDHEELKRLQIGGLLHDMGKIGIPSNILDKPGKLTEAEYAKICEHPAKGALIIEPLEQLGEVIPLIWQHHERFDGKGYPQGLAGDEIDPGAKIIAVADVFDALLSDRPYRAGMPLDKVVNIIEDGSGTLFDPEVISAFTLAMEDKGKEKKKSVLTPIRHQPHDFERMHPNAYSGSADFSGS